MTQTVLNTPTIRFMLDSTLAALTLDPKRDPEDLRNEREAAAAMLTALAPRDALQAALAARAVSAHHAAMECFRRGALPEVPDVVMTRLLASGAALSRLSLQMIKALEQRKAMVRPATTVNPIETILANTTATESPSAGSQPTAQAPGFASRTQDPPPSEPPRNKGVRSPLHQPASAGAAAAAMTPAQAAALAALPGAVFRAA
jgi:hypothetical protein